MASLGERLWEMGKSPPQHLTLLVFGLVTLLTGLIASAILALAGAGGATPLSVASSVITGIGAFFLTLALFLGAYVSPGDSVAWRIAQLIAAVLVLLLLF